MITPAPLRPLVYTNKLDPRPEHTANQHPYVAANIPLTELSRSMHELPAPGESVDIVRCAEAAEAARLLIESGRMAHVVDGVSRASTVHNLAPVFRLWRPCPLIESFAAVRQAGAALDIGCGMGRDAVFLASLEWNVTGVDILPGALDRARQLERRCAGAVVSVRWVASEARDFVTSLSSDHPAVFDMIVGCAVCGA
jgi:SAM-dependent methyltransferase